MNRVFISSLNSVSIQINIYTFSELQSNSISWVGDEIIGTFSTLSSVVKLNLAHNNIHGIPTHTFSGLVRLKHLLLDHNPISTIKEGAFQALSVLQQL